MKHNVSAKKQAHSFHAGKPKIILDIYSKTRVSIDRIATISVYELALAWFFLICKTFAAQHGYHHQGERSLLP